MRRLTTLAIVLLLCITSIFADGRDYASEVKLNMSSETLKQEVTVHAFIDGDTTHFNVPTSVSETGVLKARFLGLNTPESTGKIEEYGKKASKFTREKLENASSIIIESDDGNWNLDSSGAGRILVWVWYRNNENEQYRNLNIELLQNGLAKPYSTANTRYGNVATAALNSAKENKLNLYSGQKDPDFFYGQAIELTLKELRCHIKDYEGSKVAFEGVITMNDGSSIYIEDYDADTGLYYGISVFYGYGLPGKGLEILSVGNRSRIVGSVQYYETGGIYQISGLTYRQMKPKDPGNVQLISSGHEGAYVLTDAKTFAEGKVQIDSETYDYAYLVQGTTIEMDGLKVVSIYTETNPSSSSVGAMTMHCEKDGVSVDVRTAVLKDEKGNVVTQDAYLGKTIDVRGVVDCFRDDYQIKVLSTKDIITK